MDYVLGFLDRQRELAVLPFPFGLSLRHLAGPAAFGGMMLTALAAVVLGAAILEVAMTLPFEPVPAAAAIGVAAVAPSASPAPTPTSSTILTILHSRSTITSRS